MWRLAQRCDIIYATDTYSVGYSAYLLKKFFGKKYIIRFAGDSAWETAVGRGWTQDYITDFQKKTYDRRIEKLKKRRQKILTSADRVVAVSNFIASVAEKIGVPTDNIRVIYNSIDFISEGEIQQKTVDEIKNKYGQNADIIVTACQLVKWKGVDGLIKILPGLKERFGKISLLVLGIGQEMESLKKLALDSGLESDVHFLGKVERANMMNFFKAANLFILNSNSFYLIVAKCFM